VLAVRPAPDTSHRLRLLSRALDEDGVGWRTWPAILDGTGAPIGLKAAQCVNMTN
jgi:hypothetical protein